MLEQPSIGSFKLFLSQKALVMHKAYLSPLPPVEVPSASNSPSALSAQALRARALDNIYNNIIYNIYIIYI